MPPGDPEAEVRAYRVLLHDPVPRAPHCSRSSRRWVGALAAPTSVHRHGIRLPNALHGVAGLTYWIETG